MTPLNTSATTGSYPQTCQARRTCRRVPSDRATHIGLLLLSVLPPPEAACAAACMSLNRCNFMAASLTERKGDEATSSLAASTIQGCTRRRSACPKTAKVCSRASCKASLLVSSVMFAAARNHSCRQAIPLLLWWISSCCCCWQGSAQTSHNSVKREGHGSRLSTRLMISGAFPGRMVKDGVALVVLMEMSRQSFCARLEACLAVMALMVCWCRLFLVCSLAIAQSSVCASSMCSQCDHACRNVTH